MNWYLLLRLVAMPLTLLDAAFGDLLGHCEWRQPLGDLLYAFRSWRKPAFEIHWWGHAVCLQDLKFDPATKVYTGHFNDSWGGSWGDGKDDDSDVLVSDWPEETEHHRIREFYQATSREEIKKALGLK